MKQTFEELLKNLPGEDKINNGNQGVVIELMKKVRQATINQISNFTLENFTEKAPKEYIISEINKLDLNSIEIDE